VKADRRGTGEDEEDVNTGGDFVRCLKIEEEKRDDED